LKHSRFPMLITALVLIFFYLPIVLLVVYSFNISRFGGQWLGFTFTWYTQLFHHREIWSSLEKTLLIAVSATAVSVVVGTMAAFALHQYKNWLQNIHFALLYAPLVVPEVLMGMGLLLFFVSIGLNLGMFTIFLAHVMFCISYVTMVVLSRLQDFDFGLIEAAQDLGASRWEATRRILLPLLMPGIAAGGLLAFTLSIDDFVISFFVAGPGSTTLPIRIYSMIKHGSPTLINALSTILLLVTFVFVWLSQRLVEEKHS
jgi:spermidine/putrescine transport system permease protein